MQQQGRAGLLKLCTAASQNRLSFWWYMLGLWEGAVGCLLSLLGGSPQVSLEDEHRPSHSLSLQDCGMELNDEDGHRCYPLDEHLLCHSCHLKHIENGSAPAAAYQHHY